jgi:hypothetical protein
VGGDSARGPTTASPTVTAAALDGDDIQIPTADDFDALTERGPVDDPWAVLADYSAERAERRASNDRHRRARREQVENAASEFVEDSRSYYRAMDRPVDRTKRTYLKRLKAWFQPRSAGVRSPPPARRGSSTSAVATATRRSAWPTPSPSGG